MQCNTYRVCDGQGGCGHGCWIDGQYWSEYDRDPANDCQWCDAHDGDLFAWVARADGEACTTDAGAAGTCTGGVCQ